MIEEYVKDLKSVLSNAETLYLSLDGMDLEDIQEIVSNIVNDVAERIEFFEKGGDKDEYRGFKRYIAGD